MSIFSKIYLRSTRQREPIKMQNGQIRFQGFVTPPPKKNQFKNQPIVYVPNSPEDEEVITSDNEESCTLSMTTQVKIYINKN